MAAVQAATDRDFNSYVLAHKDGTDKVNLFDLHHKYADVMHVDQVAAHLDALAGART